MRPLGGGGGADFNHDNEVEGAFISTFNSHALRAKWNDPNKGLNKFLRTVLTVFVFFILFIVHVDVVIDETWFW
jgi:hypothetical protein